MLLDRKSEARTLYLSHNDDPVQDDDEKSWRQLVAEDFAMLRKARLTNPLMKEIEAAFAAKKH